MTDTRITPNYVEKNSSPDASRKGPFMDWLMETLKPGDRISGAQNCSGYYRQDKVFSHWDGGYPRQESGARIAPWSIYAINGADALRNPYLRFLRKDFNTGETICEMTA